MACAVAPPVVSTAIARGADRYASPDRDLLRLPQPGRPTRNHRLTGAARTSIFILVHGVG